MTDHTQKGIEFCERYTHFIKDRAKIEADYANALRFVVMHYTNLFYVEVELHMRNWHS